jgi:hypothetical protein
MNPAQLDSESTIPWQTSSSHILLRAFAIIIGCQPWCEHPLARLASVSAAHGGAEKRDDASRPGIVNDVSRAVALAAYAVNSFFHRPAAPSMLAKLSEHARKVQGTCFARCAEDAVRLRFRPHVGRWWHMPPGCAPGLRPGKRKPCGARAAAAEHSRLKGSDARSGRRRRPKPQ